MRIATKFVNVYSMDDVLSDPELKEKALEKHRDFNVEFDDWDDFILNEWKEKLENYGFIYPEINYTGFWSQGDGASFTCYRVDIPVFIEHFNDEIGLTDKQKNLLLALMKDYDVFGFEVKRRDYRYCHVNTVYVDTEDCLYQFNGYEHLQAFLTSTMQRFEDVIAEKVFEFSGKIYCELKNEYNYLTSEDAIIESLQVNNYEFTEDGNIY